MTSPLTRSVMREQLTLLNNVWPKWKLTSENFERLVEGYGGALKDFDADAVAGAVGIALKKESRFPAPAKLREYAVLWLAHNRPSQRVAIRPGEESDGTCPHCHAKPRYAKLEALDHNTRQTRIISRRIMPCVSRLHPPGTSVVPYPQNFIRWDDDDQDDELRSLATPGSGRGGPSGERNQDAPRQLTPSGEGAAEEDREAGEQPAY